MIRIAKLAILSYFINASYAALTQRVVRLKSDAKYQRIFGTTKETSDKKLILFIMMREQGENMITSPRENYHQTCSAPSHCLSDCNCIDHSCVNLKNFESAVRNCERCSKSGSEECSNGSGVCLTNIGYCSECAKSAVDQGLNSCSTNVNEEDDVQGHVFISIPRDMQSQLDIETSPEPTYTPEVPIALPPGASISPVISIPSPTPSSTVSNIIVEKGNVTIDSESADCVDTGWLLEYGHKFGILRTMSYAAVLCISELKLPCATPGHMLQFCSKGTCSLMTYSAVCSILVPCTEKISLVSRLRVNYDWSQVRDNYLSLTPYSQGNSTSSKILARTAFNLHKIGLGIFVDAVSSLVADSRTLRRTCLDFFRAEWILRKT